MKLILFLLPFVLCCCGEEPPYREFPDAEHLGFSFQDTTGLAGAMQGRRGVEIGVSPAPRGTYLLYEGVKGLLGLETTGRTQIYQSRGRVANVAIEYPSIVNASRMKQLLDTLSLLRKSGLRSGEVKTDSAASAVWYFSNCKICLYQDRSIEGENRTGVNVVRIIPMNTREVTITDGG